MTSLWAQDFTTRPVVQPLPSPEVRELERALRHLASSPRDVNALIAAGSASLKLNDLDAAIGFYGRAEEVAPNNPRVKMGQAAVLLRSGRAIDALKLFAEAETAGARPSDVLSDRGLAYDLIGDQIRAQAHYREALKVSSTDSVTIRRLALSYAISGQKPAFESVLKPLVDGRDFAAFRTQAFGLAILGEQERAAAVAEVVMPADLAARITPYLAYMPQLTNAQQAAASNLGIFPLPADVGRDDPRIAQFAARRSNDLATAPLAQTADARLEPAGEPLGASETPRARVIAAPKRAETPLASDTARLAQVVTEQVTPPVREPAQVIAASRAVEPNVKPSFDLGRVAATDAAPPAPGEPTAQVVTTVGVEPASVAARTAATDLRTTSSAALARPPETDLTPLPTREPETATLVRQSASAQPPVTANRAPSEPTSPSARANFADAFAAFEETERGAVTLSDNAVDITAIQPPATSTASRSSTAPAPDAHPRRIWVQIATGKDRAALRFDWGRLARKSQGALSEYNPHIAPWGQSNRLLAGPLDSQRAARDLVNSLSEAGIDTFSYTSPEGKEIQELK